MGEKRKAGPKAKVTETVLRDIERAISWGWSIRSACDYANIAQRTYFDYQKTHPDFRSKLDMLRSRPELLAKMNVIQRLEEGDLETSKWYLERRTAEFRPRSAVDITDHQEVDDEAVTAALERLAGLCRQPRSRLPE